MQVEPAPEFSAHHALTCMQFTYNVLYDAISGTFNYYSKRKITVTFVRKAVVILNSLLGARAKGSFFGLAVSTLPEVG